MTDTKTYEVNQAFERQVLSEDVICLKNLIGWGSELIEAGNKIDNWDRSTEVVDGGSKVTVTNKRTSDQLALVGSIHEELAPFEVAVFNAIGAGIRSYYDYNSYMPVSTDEGYTFLRYKEGDYYGEHADCFSFEHIRMRLVSAVLYLNDDYEGGELVFKRQGLKIKPEAGSLVLFPSFGTHPHEALPVTKGTKYAVVTWLK